MAPEVSEEEGIYASRFYHWFLESFKSCLLLFVALPGLINTLGQLLAWRSLLWLPMMWRRRQLTQNYFLSTASLVWSLALHFLFRSVRRKEIRWNEINIPTHTVASSHLKHESLIKALNVIVGWRKLELMSLNLILLKNATQKWRSWSA